VADHFDGYFYRYFVRYLARNKDSSLSGSLPDNVYRCFPRAIPGPSPHYHPSSFPNPSAGNFADNVQSYLENNKASYDARRGSVGGPRWTQMSRLGCQERQGTEPESSPEESNHG